MIPTIKFITRDPIEKGTSLIFKLSFKKFKFSIIRTVVKLYNKFFST